VVFNIAFEAFGLRATIRNYLLCFVFLAVGFVFSPGQPDSDIRAWLLSLRCFAR
jgi:hypothetical protein